MLLNSLSSLLAQVTVNGNAGGGGMFMGFGCIGGLLSLAAFVLFLFALIDAIRNPSLDGNSRLIWVLVIIFLPLLGSILYLVIGRK